MPTLVSATNLPTLRREVAHELIRLAAALTADGASLSSTVSAAENLLALAVEEERTQAIDSHGPAAALLNDRADTLNGALAEVIKAEFAIRNATAAYVPSPFA